MTIYLTPDQVPATLRGSYSGKAFQVTVTESMTVPMDAGLWDGGSRDTFRAVRVADGYDVPFPNQSAAPWDNVRRDIKVSMQPGIVVVEHSISRGKDMGLRFYVHPVDAAPMLPAPVELTAMESAVLQYTYGRKSSYMGKDRCAMLQDDCRHTYGNPMPCKLTAVPTRAQWDEAKASLIARGMLNKAGAITVAGRNAVGSV